MIEYNVEKTPEVGLEVFSGRPYFFMGAYFRFKIGYFTKEVYSKLK